MPSKKTTMIQEESSVEDQDSKAVLAYRVGQLEKTTASGLKEIKNELINLKTHFVTHGELEAAQTQEQLEHKAMNEETAEIKETVTDLKKWRDGIINKIALVAVGVLIMMLLALYGLDKFVKL